MPGPVKTFLLSTPIQLLALIIGIIFFDTFLPLPIARAAYTLSLIIKDGIMTVLPFAIASFIAATLMGFKKQALLVVVAILIFEGISNGTSVLYAYGAALSLESWLPMFKTITHNNDGLTPYFQIGSFSASWWTTLNGVLFGATIGIIGAFWDNGQLNQIVTKARDIASFIFSRILMRVLPLYVLGFLIYMQHSGLLTDIVNTYWWVILLITTVISVYLVGILTLASILRRGSFKVLFQNIWPTGLIAASTMSSAATMPYTIAAAEKNLRNPEFARMLIPATTNIQQVGDCIANAFLCIVILKNFGKPIPDFATWLSFMVTFTLARYTTVAMVGGAIYLMIPIYQSILGFTPEMTALILALNIVLDPIITSTNVMCNGGLAIIFEHVWLLISGQEKLTAGIDNAMPKSSLTIEYPYTRDEARNQN